MNKQKFNQSKQARAILKSILKEKTLISISKSPNYNKYLN